jgi:hypothetical protein
MSPYLFIAALGACTYSFPPELIQMRSDGSVADAGAAGPCKVPLSGRTTEAAPAAPARPERGARIADPMFGTCLTRISDRTDDAMAMDNPRDEDFDGSRFVNADGSLALYSTGFYRFFSFDPVTPRRAVATIAFFYRVLGFHGASADTVIGIDGTSFETLVITSGRTTPRSSFTLPADLIPADDLRALGRALSADGSRALVVVHGRDATVYVDTATGTVLGRSSHSVGGAKVSPSGRWVVEFDDDVARVRDPAFTEEREYRGLGRSIVAKDVFVLPNGHDGLALVDGIRLWIFDLDGTTEPIMDLALADESALGNLDFDVSIDGSAVDRPGWLVLSFGPCPSAGALCGGTEAWAKDKIVLVGVGATPVIHDLVWHRSTRPPDAIASRDLRRILFTSTWNDAGPEEIYAVEVPVSQLVLP